MAHELASHLMQSRRKWSDWSECSTSCVRTRHRLNCDDLLASQNSTAKPVASKLAANDDKKSSVSERILRSGPILSGKEEEGYVQDGALSVVHNNEDDDYADEGDEADEVDSCDSVLDTSKTFEQQPCSDGQCRLSVAVPINNGVGSGGDKQSPQVTSKPGRLSIKARKMFNGHKSRQEFGRPIVVSSMGEFEVFLFRHKSGKISFV